MTNNVKYYYSAETKGFYTDELFSEDNLPEDAVEITKAKYDELLTGQHMGQLIELDNDGVPQLVDRPPASYEYKLAVVHKQRQRAYREESDPLFFEYQQGEIDETTWLEKIAEIKARYPLPES